MSRAIGLQKDKLMSISHQDETPEERAARVDDILAKNASQGICISCGEDIRANEAVIDTMHGLYHGPPKTCVEGRPDRD